MAHTYKITEIVGSSTESFADAVRSAVKRASKNLHNLGWFEVIEQRGLIKEDHVAEFQVTVKIGFRLDD